MVSRVVDSISKPGGASSKESASNEALYTLNSLALVLVRKVDTNISKLS